MTNFGEKQKGFTLVELLLVMSVMAVMLLMRMQAEQNEIEQLQARNLGANELVKYHNAVQTFLSSNSGDIDPSTIEGTYSGVNWLKDSDECSDGNADSAYLQCNFLASNDGKTTFGQMEFETTITHDEDSGFEARTVLTRFEGMDSDTDASGILGLAALVANSSLNLSGGAQQVTGGAGNIIYCPDIDPMPSSLSDCGDERDQIIMLANVRGANDVWLRVDHGNTMQNALEMKTESASGEGAPSPSDESALKEIDNSTMRQIRNVARIYNLGDGAENTGNDNLFLGSHYANEENGNIVDSSGNTTSAWQWVEDVVDIERGVVVDADQQILRDLFVYENIFVEQGDVVVEKGDVETQQGDVKSGRDLEVDEDARVNGWVNVGSQSTGSLNDGDLQAENTYSKRYYDSDNDSYYVDPDSNSQLNEVTTSRINGDNNLTVDSNNLTVDANRTFLDSGRVDFERSQYWYGRDTRINNFKVRNMANESRYSLEDMLPPYTFIGSVRIRSRGRVYIRNLANDANCPLNRIRAYGIPMTNEYWARRNTYGGTNTTRGYLAVSAHRVYRSGGYLYYRYYHENPPRYTSSSSGSSFALVQIYCDRTH